MGATFAVSLRRLVQPESLGTEILSYRVGATLAVALQLGTEATSYRVGATLADAVWGAVWPCLLLRSANPHPREKKVWRSPPGGLRHTFFSRIIWGGEQHHQNWKALANRVL